MPITPQEALQRTIEHREIFHDEMLKLMRMIMSGEMSPVMTAALLTGLRVKKETIGEISAAAQVMREFSAKVEVPVMPHFVDIVGTGGDGLQNSKTLLLSTVSMDSQTNHQQLIEMRNTKTNKICIFFHICLFSLFSFRASPSGSTLDDAFCTGRCCRISH